MNKILLLHGPNLNLLGKRDPAYYGHCTLRDIENMTEAAATTYGFQVLAFQSNHEGVLIDILQTEARHCAGIIINPGAYAHSSYAIYDALLDTTLPAIEVHLSAISERESWRRLSVTAAACLCLIAGKQEKGYQEAVKLLVEHIST